LFRSNDEALIDELGRAGEKPICTKSFTRTIRRRGFFRSFAEDADFSVILMNFHIFVAQISVRQTCHCRNLDAELIRGLRAHPDERVSRIRAVALTAYARGEDRLRALKAGFYMHVPKPVDEEELTTVIAR